jgi:hypothetical protein
VGAEGKEGKEGAKGEKGTAGAEGKEGPKCAKGGVGAEGKEGPTGAEGKEGKEGKQGNEGAAGAAGKVEAGVYSAKTARAVATEYEASATEPVQVFLTVTTSAALAKFKIEVDGVAQPELVLFDKSAEEKHPITVIVPTGKQWKVNPGKRQHNCHGIQLPWPLTMSPDGCRERGAGSEPVVGVFLLMCP